MSERWIGRASRNIRSGEELFIGYLNCHNPTPIRQRETQYWGFSCACLKCENGLDYYTDSLEEERDLANGIRPADRSRLTASIRQQRRRHGTMPY